jgi:hypothetical protein
MFQQRSRSRTNPSAYTSRRSWHLNLPPIAKPPYSPSSLTPGALVFVYSGDMPPPLTSYLYTAWKAKNFYARVTECTELSARVTKANGMSVVLHSAINNIRLATKEEVARVQQDYPHL